MHEEVARPNLSREVIATVALELIDEGGLAGLSMRKLGARLGVEAMSLYHYVSSKDDLLDAAVEQIYLEIDIPEFSEPQGWEGTVRMGLESFHRALARHPRALALFATRPAVTPGAFAVLGTAYRRLHQAGLSPKDAHGALNMLVSFVLGHVAFSIEAHVDADGRHRVPVDASIDPELAAYIEAGSDLDTDDLFRSGLDTIIAGVRTQFRLP